MFTDLGLVLVVESLLHLGVPVDGHIRLSCRHTEADLESVTFINTAHRTIQMSLQQGQNNEECVGERFTKFVKFLLTQLQEHRGRDLLTLLYIVFFPVSGGKNVSRIIFQHSSTPEDSEGFFLEKLKCIYERKKCFCAYSEFFTLRFMPVTQRTKKLRKKSKEIILSPVKKHQHILTCCSDWRTSTTHFQNFKCKKSLFHKE